MGAIVLEWWPVLTGLFAFVVWLVRLESRINTAGREVARVDADSAREVARVELDSRQNLARLEQRLSDQRKEDREQRARDWEAMNRSLAEMAVKIDAMPERIITLLDRR